MLLRVRSPSPAYLAEVIPGNPLSVSTSSPESSAMVTSPESTSKPPGPSSRHSQIKILPSSSRSGTRVNPSTLKSEGPTRSRPLEFRDLSLYPRCEHDLQSFFPIILSFPFQRFFLNSCENLDSILGDLHQRIHLFFVKTPPSAVP